MILNGLTVYYPTGWIYLAIHLLDIKLFVLQFCAFINNTWEYGFIFIVDYSLKWISKSRISGLKGTTIFFLVEGALDGYC